MIKLKKEFMSVNDWIDIDDCPIQRDTERHARIAVNKHLRSPSITHANVSAARLENGQTYKLDGHTRAYLWSNNLLQPPVQNLNVDVYCCDNLLQVKELYQQFDNKSASEDLRDKLYGAFRLTEFNPKSSLVANGGITSALAIILGVQFSQRCIYDAIPPFIHAIRMIDDENFSIKPFPSPILSAMILTVYKDSESALNFWRAYANDEGVKSGRERDGAQELTELLLSTRSLTGGAWGHTKKNQIAGRALSTYLAYQGNRMYTTRAKATDFAKYILEKTDILRGIKNIKRDIV